MLIKDYIQDRLEAELEKLQSNLTYTNLKGAEQEAFLLFELYKAGMFEGLQLAFSLSQ